MPTSFHRNVRASDLLETFLVTAVSSLLLVRLGLRLFKYPQIGGGHLHVAHMLWGGFLMMAAIVMLFLYLGRRVQHIAAVVGGVGFGVFIDELGKFITKDNNYFFQPTIGIIYAIFAALYLVFNFLGRKRRLTSEAALLNALVLLEEVVARDLDTGERDQLLKLLASAAPHHPLAASLRTFVQGAPADTHRPAGRIGTLLRIPERAYTRLLNRHYFTGAVQLFFIAETALLLVLTASLSISEVGYEFSDHVQVLLGVGQTLASGFATLLAIIGAFRFGTSRLEAYEYFRRAALVNILLTNFFLFTRFQFAALPSLFFQLLILLGIRYATRQERHQ